MYPNNKRYYTLDNYYKTRFGKKVFKVSLNGGFSCPNKDGTIASSACIYCSKSGSGEFGGNPKKSIEEQFEEVKNVTLKKWETNLYIAYFQANTNTYAPLERLKFLYESALNIEGVIGLAIATRADSISDEVLDYLEELNKRTYLSIELGLQTIHEKTSKLIKRGHSLKTFEEMVKKLRARNIEVVVHIINGLPNETKEEMLATVKYLNNLDIQGIKIHMLAVLKNTELENLYQKEKFHLLSREEYVDIVCSQLEVLKKEIVIHRVTTDPDPKDLIAPLWLKKKFVVMNEIDKLMKKRKTHQSSKIGS